MSNIAHYFNTVFTVVGPLNEPSTSDQPSTSDGGTLAPADLISSSSDAYPYSTEAGPSTSSYTPIGTFSSGDPSAGNFVERQLDLTQL